MAKRTARGSRRSRGHRLDGLDRKLLLSLSKDGRRAAASLAEDLGVSRQAVAERIRQLERAGVIRGFRADLDPASLGLLVRAQVRLTMNYAAGVLKEKEMLRRLTGQPMVRSVYRVSGEDCFVAQVVCRRIEDLNALLLDLQSTGALQSSRTAFVLESVMEKGALGPVEDGLLSEQR